MRKSVRVASAAAALVAVVGLVGCGSSSKSSDTTTTAAATTTTAFDQAAATTQAEAAIVGFLTASSAEDALKNVQGGTNKEFAAAYTAIYNAIADAKLNLPGGVTAKDVTVTFSDNNTMATGTYAVVGKQNGQVVIPKQAAEWTLVDGKWVLTATSVCDLSAAGASAAQKPELNEKCAAAAENIK
ncbi:MAG: hypothetical protein ACOYNI_11720 [Acidimicrobiia bacterium]